MFAVIKTGGKQYRVAANDVVTIEKLDGVAGDKIEFTEILMVGVGADATIGAPFVEGAVVSAEVVEQGRAKKVIAFKKRRRQNSKRTRGHRQHQTTVRILDIAAAGKAKKASKKTEAAAEAAN
ncbi:50S ribosomal protein L21 [Pararhizobium sp. LjRoot255]|uniref:50S ribosomal protein L21 n=1 Tax=Pararhizobium sp. LjRoot255 TaxID=3342298 RepID=UPI003ECD8426